MDIGDFINQSIIPLLIGLFSNTITEFIKYLVINLNNLDSVDNIGYQAIDNISQIIKNKNGKVLIIDRYNHFFNPDLLALNIIKI